jgi:glycosidase
MIAKGDWPANSLDKMLTEEQASYPKNATRMRHLDNHDMTYMGYAWSNRDHLDPSVYPYLENTSLSDKYGAGRLAFATLTATLPNSQPMIWNGEEIGILDRTPNPIQWVENGDREFYSRLFGAYRQVNALQNGTFRKLHSGADDSVFAFERESGSSKAVVVLNLSKAPHSVKIDGLSGRFREVFSGNLAELSQGADLNLLPWDYRLYVKDERS